LFKRFCVISQQRRRFIEGLDKTPRCLTIISCAKINAKFECCARRNSRIFCLRDKYSRMYRFYRYSRNGFALMDETAKANGEFIVE